MEHSKLDSSSWIQKPGYGRKKTCPGFCRFLNILLLLLFGLGSLTLPVVAIAAEQNVASEEAKSAETQAPQSENVDDSTETSADSQDLPVTSKVETPTLESASKSWRERVEVLREEVDKGIKTPKDADLLYEELSKELRLKRKALDKALSWARSPAAVVDTFPPADDVGEPEQGQSVTVEDIYNSMVSLYQTRTLLLRAVSLGLKTRITGRGEATQAKFKGEMEYMVLYLRFHAMSIPQLGPQLKDQLVATPILVIFQLLELMLVIILFRWWRQWAPQGLVNLRGRIMRIKPRTKYSLRLARLVWYLQEVRSPLEWMFLLGFIMEIISTPSLLVIEDFLHIIFNALLFAWFAVRLINAIASRGVAGLADDISGLRLRSLRLVAGWFLVLSMGLKLVVTYTGEGTTYALVWTLFEMLSIPVVFLLLSWWRLEVRQRLEELPSLPGWVKGTTQRSSLLRRYVNTLLGAFYLIYIALRRFALRQLSRFSGGRELVVKLIGLELFAEQERKALTLKAEPIPSELSDKLLSGKMQCTRQVYGKELKRLIELVEYDDGGLVSIRGERGIGKSQLLNDLAQKFDEKCVIVKCTMRGFDGVVQDLADKFSLPHDQLNSDRFLDQINENNIRFVAFDDIHLLARPKMNGVVELEKLSEFVEPLRSGVKVCVIVTMIRTAHQYLSRLRGERAVLADTLELPAWDQEQITQLIESHSQQAGIEADFSEIDIPYQYDDYDFDSPDDRIRMWFFRILWNMSAGNPSVALRLWNESLAQTPEGRIVVQVLPQVFALDQMDNTNLSILLMLRVIIQSGMTTADDIAESLQLPSNVVKSSIRYALHSGWIEETDSYYRVTWRWFRTVKRVLIRQNLLAR